MNFKKLIPLLFLALHAPLLANPYWVAAGAEIYHIRRLREGGTHQEGILSGLKISMDRIKPYGLYCGADYLYATGALAGMTAAARPMQSYLTDQIAEGRVGFTFSKVYGSAAFITPYVGWGYFKEVNSFCPPTTIPCTFTDQFQFFAAGFLSGRQITPYFALGLNFKMRFMQKAISQIEDPYLQQAFSLQMKEEIHTRLEIPLLFQVPNPWSGLGFLLAPFYEYRHFGGREGYPYDFKDTQFYLLGARLALSYQF